MQRYPICFGCGEPVEYDPIFEAPCGHDDHPSVVWHGVCLMEHREHLAIARARIKEYLDEHGEHDY